MGDDWYCPKCERFVGPASVTFEETHDICGTPVLGASPFERITELETALATETQRADKAEAELVKCKGANRRLSDAHVGAVERAEQAEADLKLRTDAYNELGQMVAELKADLAAAREEAQTLRLALVNIYRSPLLDESGYHERGKDVPADVWAACETVRTALARYQPADKEEP